MTHASYFGVLRDRIVMFWNEHMPPHFHAEFGAKKILVDIQHVSVIKGVFPFKQLKLVLAWAEIHREELLKNWEKAQRHTELQRIDPLV